MTKSNEHTWCDPIVPRHCEKIYYLRAILVCWIFSDKEEVFHSPPFHGSPLIHELNFFKIFHYITTYVRLDTNKGTYLLLLIFLYFCTLQSIYKCGWVPNFLNFSAPDNYFRYLFALNRVFLVCNISLIFDS